MALTGLEIYKQLPKTNCKECSYATCLAFAVALAGGKSSLDACPHVSEEARALLDAAAAPPMAKVIVGTGNSAVELGGETELFRHDKRFNQPAAIALTLSDTLCGMDLTARLNAIRDMVFYRVGQAYRAEMVMVKDDSGRPDNFTRAAVAAADSGLALMLMSEVPETMSAALEAVAGIKPLIYAASDANCDAMADVARKFGCPLVVRAQGLEALAGMVDRLTASGIEQLVLDPEPENMSQALADFTQLRRQAVRKRFRPFGYPLVAFTFADNPREECLEAAVYVSKYASIVVLKTIDRANILPLLTWRQNLYADPQVPIQVEEELNEVGAPDENSPVFVTTNFSLTYYSVQGEIESSRIPAYVIPVATDGMSVLTAYADGRFTAETIARVMEKLDLKRKVSHRNIIIPGSVAVLKRKLAELTGWNVIVGPREASGIPAFARSNFGPRTS